MNKYGVKKKDGISIMVEQPNPGIGGRHREIHKELVKQNSDLIPRDALAQSVSRARKIYQQDRL